MPQPTVNQRDWMLGIAAVLVGLYLGWMGIYRPMMAQWVKVQEATVQHKEYMKVLTELNAVKEQIESRSASFETDGQVSALMSQVTALANASRVEVVSIVPDKSRDYGRSGFRGICARVEVSGEYAKLGDFLALLEGNARYYRIETLDVSPLTGPVATRSQGRIRAALMVCTMAKSR